jgi:hypothetical protein
MFYFAPSNLPLNWLTDGLIRTLSLRCGNQMDAFRQRGCHHVSPWAERYLPIDAASDRP